MGNSGYLLALCPLFLLEWCADRGVFCKILIPRLTLKRVSMLHHLNTAPRRERNKTFCYHKANYATTRHITPLSPWRGVGGEASCRRCMAYGVRAIRVSLRLTTFVLKAYYTPLSPWRGAGGEASRGWG